MFEKFVGYDDRRMGQGGASPEAVVRRKLGQAIADKMNVVTEEMPFGSGDAYQPESSLEYSTLQQKVPGTGLASSPGRADSKATNPRDDGLSTSENVDSSDSDHSQQAEEWLTVSGMKELTKRYQLIPY